MKTVHLIEVLRCPGDSFDKCGTCKAGDTCQELIHFNLYNICADRLEKLLADLKHNELELKEARAQARFWEKKYKRFFDNMKNIIGEEEVLNDYGV